MSIRPWQVVGIARFCQALTIMLGGVGTVVWIVVPIVALSSRVTDIDIASELQAGGNFSVKLIEAANARGAQMWSQQAANPECFSPSIEAACSWCDNEAYTITMPSTCFPEPRPNLLLDDALMRGVVGLPELNYVNASTYLREVLDFNPGRFVKFNCNVIVH